MNQPQRPVRSSWWHGTAGHIEGRTNIHIGTYEAAKQALEARIGVPADGVPWDGTREYGKTLLAGSATLKRLGLHETGYNAGYCESGPHKPLSQKDAYPNGTATHSDHTPISPTAKPDIFQVCIVGPMLNDRYNPKTDTQANSLMNGQIKRGRAKNGYYYVNAGEDAGSISAVVPTSAHLVRITADNPIPFVVLEPHDLKHIADVAAKIQKKRNRKNVCAEAANAIEDCFRHQAVAGFYIGPDHRKMNKNLPHCWNQLDDGTIIDGTANQFPLAADEPMPRIVAPNDPRQAWYVWITDNINA
jgi:hypothetical protein